MPAVVRFFTPRIDFMSIVRVNLGPRSYDIAVGSGDRAGLGLFARERAATAGAPWS